MTVTYLPWINYNSASSITYDTSCVLNFDAGGNPAAQFFVTAAAGSITFTSARINLLNGACAGNIFWVSSVATTVTLMTSTPPTFNGNIIAGTGAITSAAPVSINGRIYTNGTAITFAGAGPNTATLINCPVAVICYAKGTKIMTPNGYRSIEKLKVDDAVITMGRIRGNDYVSHEASSKPITWISNFTLKNPNREGKPIRFMKGSLGQNTPSEDLYVSAGHNMMVGGKAVPAWELINGTTIARDTECEEVTYYHFEVNEHSAVVANGALSETFAGGRFNENRGVFKQATMVLPTFSSVRINRPFLKAGGRF